MTIPTDYVKSFYKGILEKRECNKEKCLSYHFDELMSAGGILANEGPPVENFYLKPLHIISPHELMPHGKPLVCNCGKKLSLSGWSTFRYVHSLKTGRYIVQRQYRSHSTCICAEKSYYGLQALKLDCIPNCVRLMYPFIEKYNSMYDQDIISYITGDALTGIQSLDFLFPLEVV